MVRIFLRRATLVACVLMSPVITASEDGWSYSVKEMYQMATYYRQAQEGKELRGIKSQFLAREFRGYIAGLFDMQDNKECARKHSRDEIIFRAAVIATQDSSDNEKTKFNVRYALFLACDDSTWKKEPKS